MDTFDVVVIGAGPGGYPAAIRAAQLGASVALVEKEHLGGACLNWGCIPSKTLIASSDLYSRFQNAATMGIAAESIRCDYAALLDRKNHIVDQLRGGVKQLLKANGVKVLSGEASFEARDKLLIRPAGGAAAQTIGAARIIIATGADSVMPAFLPRHDRVLDSRIFLDQKDLPATALVLGGGVIGCEFACLLAQFGCKVTLVEMLDDIIAGLDADLRAELRRQMEKHWGIRIWTGCTLEDIVAGPDRVRARVGSASIEADRLIAALGRRPVTSGLRLENAGLSTNAAGAIEVDAYGRSRVANIFAIGDVTGGVQLAHAATSQGIVAAENACTRNQRRNERHIPNCIFTAPEIGTVGLSEDRARAEGRAVKTGKFPFAALGRSLASGERAGFVKWVADAATGQLLGAHAVGPHATELIAEATLALKAEFTGEELARTIHAHPTFAEAWAEAAHVLIGEPVHVSPLRRTEGAAGTPSR